MIEACGRKSIEVDEALRLLRCPVCRARFSGEEPAEEPCRRCGTELRLVRGACRRAGHHRRLARLALALGQPAVALAEAHRAVSLLNVAATRATYVAALAAAGLTGNADGDADVNADGDEG
ncbi:MAG: hypothetical protein FJ125_15315 [Deltaproteobacteria bacterium]|nr:hypothetical protein [Deltaproteobacteria bacterium]